MVVNCGALSVPRMCEQDPEAAMAINIPRSVVEWLLSQDMSIPPLLIHLSSDQGKFPISLQISPQNKKKSTRNEIQTLSSLLFSMVFQAGLFFL